MKITVLGCGSSAGVPLVGGDWGVCDPNDPRNRRSRVSVLVEKGDTTILIDTSPDMREQMLAANVKKLDAVLFTHAHADHSHGIDELRTFSRLAKKQIDIYSNAETLRNLETRFGYIFTGTSDKMYKPAATMHLIEGKFEIGGIAITSFTQSHIQMQTLGFRLDDFAYSTDVKRLDEAAFAALAGIKVWVVDCAREKEHPTHSHLAQTLDWIARARPERAILTHMNETLDYAKLAAQLPRGVEPGYDGLTIEC